MALRTSLLTLAMIGATGAANGEIVQQPVIELPATVNNGSPPAHGPHKMAISDEYGFQYDTGSNRLNAAGHVVSPPHTPAEALVIQNGPGSES